ncbi:helix-turn-helix domain-containing protein [Clostridium grantii]|uniref:Putative DNA-binding domain-containing protein n=1 Tax=Clostridium grantii DSM 8605 TaxID=1121316 RepID=A0A1M5RCH0_9CLOT|nr:ATP-binding protein [Clostridium grantii]SHH23981.1 Putative DNA-binding domain-containing protein [Clostridium grantii DSM 8605]
MEINNYIFREDVEIECKEAKGGLPKDIWETYSSFANTSGGTIYLGVKEKKGDFTVSGVDTAEKILKEFWDNLNNPKKISSNILNESNVQVLDIDNNKVIKITVLKADRRQKPVYIGENPFNQGKHSGTFRRNYEGDYKCSNEEIKRMIADQLDRSQDSLIL